MSKNTNSDNADKRITKFSVDEALGTLLFNALAPSSRRLGTAIESLDITLSNVAKNLLDKLTGRQKNNLREIIAEVTFPSFGDNVFLSLSKATATIEWVENAKDIDGVEKPLLKSAWANALQEIIIDNFALVENLNYIDEGTLFEILNRSSVEFEIERWDSDSGLYSPSTFSSVGYLSHSNAKILVDIELGVFDAVNVDEHRCHDAFKFSKKGVYIFSMIDGYESISEKSVILVREDTLKQN